MMNPFGFFPQVSRTSPVSKIVRVLLMSLYVPANWSSAAIVKDGSAAIVAASISFLIFARQCCGAKVSSWQAQDFRFAPKTGHPRVNEYTPLILLIPQRQVDEGLQRALNCRMIVALCRRQQLGSN